MPPTDDRWHALSADDAARRFGTDTARGLRADDAARRLDRVGPNALPEAPPTSIAALVARQFRDFMIVVLLAAAAVATALGELLDGAAILVIVVLNAIVGAVQEYRAERAMAALRSMAAPSCRVRRDGAVGVLPSEELVPGDVVLLEAGDVAPADVRLLETHDVETQEAALTGESTPVEKDAAPVLEGDTPVADRRNTAFKGTQVTRGTAVGLVVATGEQTELGRIAALLERAESVPSPLKRRLARFGRRLAVAVLGIAAVVFALGLLRGEPVLLMFLTAVSLAVAAIPEALPAVVTIALALGARRMSRHAALVRRLPAVETLGSVTFICADKTGTLTKNEMHVETLRAGDARLDRLPPPGASAETDHVGAALALCGDATRDADGRAIGDPTEVALLEAAEEAGFSKEELERRRPRVAELPFDANRRAMTTVHHDEATGAVDAYTKGAPENVVPLCRAALSEAGEAPLDPARALADVDALAGEGYRVLALAWRRHDACPAAPDAEALERDLVLLGFVGLIDPPRPEVEDAIADCRRAGIEPVMITGDHPATGRAIARRLHILPSDRDEAVVTGRELQDLSPDRRRERVRSARVYARVTPEQKLDIVEALQTNGECVAMTGDGVNDAPALRQADIGVAMGKGGTDVAREAADMVLLDDHFATIVHAVREGRRIDDNVRKFVKYTMTSNAGEIWTILLAPFLGLPLPLLPIQILWVNLVTDGLPGLALADTAAERGVMRRPPRPPRASIFARGLWPHVLWVGLLIGGLSLGAQAWAIEVGSDHWRTVVFTVLTFAQLAHSIAICSERESVFARGSRPGRSLVGAVLLTTGLQLLVIYVPPLQIVFHTTALGLRELAVCFLLPAAVLLAVEAEKWGVRRGLYGAKSTAATDVDEPDEPDETRPRAG